MPSVEPTSTIFRGYRGQRLFRQRDLQIWHSPPSLPSLLGSSDLLEKRYGKKERANGSYATTDKAKGALLSLAEAEGYERFVIPDDVVTLLCFDRSGLLPIAVAGIDIDELMAGRPPWRAVGTGKQIWTRTQPTATRRSNILYRKGKLIEILVSYEPALQYFAEVETALGESEGGKDQRGLYPASVIFSTDLHSLASSSKMECGTSFETVGRSTNPAVIWRSPVMQKTWTTSITWQERASPM